MTEQTLGDLLYGLTEVEYPPLDLYMLFVPCEATASDYELQPSTRCAVLLIPRDQAEYEEFTQNLATTEGLCDIISIEDVQDIVINAYQQKVNCSPEELVKALNYYLKYDGFYSFDDDKGNPSIEED